jgi:phosphatidylinositol alpha-1,6-mannosyltransferase
MCTIGITHDEPRRSWREVPFTRKQNPMRVLMITRNFPPLVGGMERLLQHAYLELHKQFDVDLVGPAGCEPHAIRGSVVRGCALRPLPLFLFLSYVRARKLARSQRPDLILAGSGLTALPALWVGRRFGIPVITMVHGLDLIVSNPVYQRMFVPALRRCDRVIVNSRNTGEIARCKGIDIDRIRVLHPGVAVPVADSVYDTADFRARHGIDEDEVILLSVGRLTRRKGLAEFVEHALPRIVAAAPRVRLLVIGGNASSAVRGSGDERQRIADIGRKSGVDSHLLFLGSVAEEELVQAYVAARCLVFPVLDLPDDVEGFGMVAVEAAAHGLPTVAFAAGGVSDAVAPGVSGFLVASGDYAAMADVITDQVDSELTPEQREHCRQFAAQFSWERYGDRLIEVCRDAVGGRAPD